MGDSFTPAWLAGEARATALLARDFTEPGRRRAQVEAALGRPVAAAFAAAWRAQEARRPQSAARSANLEAVTSGGAACVVTGQQVGLFLGPLYTIHKAVAAIVDARALAEETGRPVVPVFWLQTEDADFEEIRRVGLPGEGAPELVEIDDALGPEGARGSMAHRPLGAGVEAALDQLEEAIGRLRFGAEVVALCRRHYRPEATFGDAFAGVMAELFADEGLLLLDPRAPEMAALSAPLHREALTRAGELSAALEARAEALEAAGFDVQVPVREGAPLSCFHQGGVEGPRYRLVPDESGAWEVAGADARVTSEALVAALDEDARRFSTTALLRPLLQDGWLPTAAYVGGPGELAYFSELPPLYEALDRPMPMAVPRARFRILGPTDGRLADKLGLTLDDAERPYEELLAELGARASARQGFDVDGEERALVGSLTAALERLAQVGAEVDGGLPKAADKARAAVEDIVGRAFERYRRGVARSQENTRKHLARLQGILAPSGAPQERALGFPYFAAQHGPRALVEALLAAARPFHPDVVDVRP